MEDIKVTSSLDFKTYFKISLYISFGARAIILIIIYFLFMQVASFAWSPFSWQTELEIIAFTAFLFGGFMPLNIYLACRKRMKKSAVLNETLIYHINPEKIEVKGETISSSTGWRYIPRLIEREKYFLLMINARSFHYLPKNGFESRDGIARFKQIVKEKGIKIKYS